VLAEDQESASLYKYFGYGKVRIMQNVPRLYNAKQQQSPSSKRSVSRSHLIATGLHDTQLVISIMMPHIRSNPFTHYYIRCHPKAVIRPEQFHNLPKNCEITDISLHHLFTIVDMVHATYSSVGLEAFNFGIDVNFIDIPGRVSQRPIIAMNAKYQ
jgi:hypothetical protein